jgi:hypothetical protein
LKVTFIDCVLFTALKAISFINQYPADSVLRMVANVFSSDIHSGSGIQQNDVESVLRRAPMNKEGEARRACARNQPSCTGL